MSDEPKQFEKPLTLRERVAVHVLMLIYRIVKAGDIYQEDDLQED
jgi:hypothetical protein